MSLQTYEVADDLYLARGAEVNPRRPLFTGDVYDDVEVPGLDVRGKAIVIAHPCAVRGAGGCVSERVLVAPVEPHPHMDPKLWTRGHYALTPLPDLVNQDLYVGRFDQMGRALSTDLSPDTRLACLSAFGINLLQQRLIWHLSRLEVETFRLNDALAHVYEEADLLEEWTETVAPIAGSDAEAVAMFDEFMRKDRGNARNLQSDLRNPELRPSVRKYCREEAERIKAAPRL